MPDDLTEGKEDVDNYDFTAYINWNYIWFAIIPIVAFVICLRHICCPKRAGGESQAPPVVLGQTSPPQYTANTFNTNFSNQPQYNNAAFSSSQSNLTTLVRQSYHTIKGVL